jgi:hypothetical protein
MSNYPPGVTGSEYEIAGPDYESEELRTCTVEDVAVIQTHVMQNQVRAILLDVRMGNSPHVAIKATMDLLAAATASADCGFSGEVLVQGYGAQRWWTCPMCGHQHDEEPEDWR